MTREPIKGQFDDLLGIGGSPVLDFLNTISTRKTESEFDRLENYYDLANWAWATGIITDSELQEIKTIARQAPEKVQVCFDEAIHLREIMYDMLLGLIRDDIISENLANVSKLIFPLIAESSLRIEDSNKFQLVHEPDQNALKKPIWLVAWDAFRLATGTEISRLKQCESCKCSWLFLDQSKNGSRRWCSMQECGAAIKAREYRARRRNSDPQ